MSTTEFPAATIDYAPPAIAPASIPKAPRLVSLDVFRGITIAGMLLVNNPGNPGKGEVYAPLEHANWHGWTPTDLIFPFFLFIVGVAIPFSMAKRASAPGETRGSLLSHVWIRALSLFMLGELLQGFPFINIAPVPPGFGGMLILRIIVWTFCSAGIIALLVPWRSQRLSIWIPVAITLAFYALAFCAAGYNHLALKHGLASDFAFGNGLFRPEKLRVPGVLQRIGICYGCAATIGLLARFDWRIVVASTIALFAIYSSLMLNAPYRNHVKGSLTAEDNLARRIDESVFNKWGHHAYGEYPDPEGLLSSLPAIGSVLLGILVGVWLRTARPAAERCAAMLAMALLLAIAYKTFNSMLDGRLDYWLLPINKKIWTPSFALFTAWMGTLGLGAIFWLVDIANRRRWALPFLIFGANAIAAFIIGGMVTRAEFLIKVHDQASDKNIPLLTYLRDHAALGIDKLAAAVHLPALASPGMSALAYSIPYVIVILLLMSILYFLKIFVKV